MKKFYLSITLWLYSIIVFAQDTFGIPQLDQGAKTWQNGMKVVAKWGGIGLLVGAGIMLGLGKLKGEALGFMFYVLLGLGIICAAFGWWDTMFTSGFAF